MSVDTSNWSEDPARNGEITGMSLAQAAPASNTAAMVATLMAAIKNGDLTDAALQAAINELNIQIEALEQSIPEPASAITTVLNCWLIWFIGIFRFLLKVRKLARLPSVKPPIFPIASIAPTMATNT